MLEEVKQQSAGRSGMGQCAECKPKALYSLSRKPRRIARTGELWLLGKIRGKPKDCILCGAREQLWRHFEQCSEGRGAEEAVWQGRWTEAAGGLINDGKGKVDGWMDGGNDAVPLIGREAEWESWRK